MHRCARKKSPCVWRVCVCASTEMLCSLFLRLVDYLHSCGVHLKLHLFNVSHVGVWRRVLWGCKRQRPCGQCCFFSSCELCGIILKFCIYHFIETNMKLVLWTTSMWRNILLENEWDTAEHIHMPGHYFFCFQFLSWKNSSPDLYKTEVCRLCLFTLAKEVTGNNSSSGPSLLQW